MSVRLANSTRTPPNSLLAEEKEELGSCSTLSESDVSAFVSELTDQPTPPSVNQPSSLTLQGNLI